MGLADDAWLAGFADGEGCFLLYRRGEGFVPRFALQLRADDRPILEALREEFEIGTVNCFAELGRKHLKASWVVVAKSELTVLVDYFDRFPLRAKKARDYAVWREAALAYVEGGSRDLRLPDLFQQLLDGRQFTEAS